jgi:hypothetical protein
MLVDFLNDPVGELLVSHMTPPDKHIGVIQNLIGKTALFIFKRCGPHLYIIVL